MLIFCLKKRGFSSAIQSGACGEGTTETTHRLVFRNKWGDGGRVERPPHTSTIYKKDFFCFASVPSSLQRLRTQTSQTESFDSVSSTGSSRRCCVLSAIWDRLDPIPTVYSVRNATLWTWPVRNRSYSQSLGKLKGAARDQ